MSDRVELKGSSHSDMTADVALHRTHPHEWMEVTARVKKPLTDDDREWLEALGFEFNSFDDRHGFWSGNAEHAEQFFGVKLYEREGENGSTFRTHLGPVTLDPSIAPLIEGVFGLDTRPVARTQFRKHPSRIFKALSAYAAAVGDAKQEAFESAYKSPPGTFTPPQVATAYDFPKSDGHGQCVAIIELGGGYRVNDLRAYFQSIGTPMPTVMSVSVDHTRNSPGGDADGEVMLDVEVVAAIAPKAKIVVYFCPNTDKGFLDGISAAVHDNVNKPSVISISWGGPESNWTSAAMNAMNSVLEQAAQAGITVLVASGDDGSTDGVSDGKQHVDFPASSPWVTACGGTKLTVSNGTATDVVWNELQSNEGAGGGGFSTQFAVPDYQQGHIPPGSSGRGVPDVSGDADPVSGFLVRVDGQQEVIGGTSAVAPLYAGLVARINSIRGKRIGLLNLILYSTPGICRDVTQGNNGDFSATEGWDAASGLGVIDGQKLLVALGSK
jgi:kumamolisin